MVHAFQQMYNAAHFTYQQKLQRPANDEVGFGGQMPLHTVRNASRSQVYISSTALPSPVFAVPVETGQNWQC